MEGVSNDFLAYQFALCEKNYLITIIGILNL